MVPWQKQGLHKVNGESQRDRVYLRLMEVLPRHLERFRRGVHACSSLEEKSEDASLDNGWHKR